MPFKKIKTPVDYSTIEKRILDFWEKNHIFEKSVTTRPESKPFTFYEGPPTANGKPGIHHVISRTVKDFVCRYKTMQGYRVNRKAGWDTHGLPVEIEVEKALGLETKDEIEAYGVAKFNKKCRESVFTYLKDWNELTKRIGFWVDLSDPYITYTNEYIETVWWLLAQMWKKDVLYKGFKILPYCPRCETALSSHETSLGYKEVKDYSITAKFPLIDQDNRFVLAWTTTPWTLPGNVALAVGGDILYVEVEQEVDNRKEIYYLAENRLDILKGEYTILRSFPGKEMEGWKYKPLFDFIDLSGEGKNAYTVALADFVTTDEGTGVVHTAVMYGEDDYRLGMEIGLPAVHTVDEQGRFNERVPFWQGRYVKEEKLEKEIIENLKQNGRLYKTQLYTHSYPHCWRCDSALLYYAKRSWYIKTTAFKDQLIENNNSIDWYPREVGEGRLGMWLDNNVDWALSRTRYWGTPLNIWICPSCEKHQVIGSMEELKKLSGQNEIKDLHKPFIDEIKISCPDCGKEMQRTPEVIDCWFDSGAMPYAQFHYPFEDKTLFNKNFPADFIAEGVDQTRGWFYSLLAISTIISGKPSYKSCISIEMILDKEGQKMSKSRGNSVDPFNIINAEGADTLRWYLYTVSPPWVPTRFDREGLTEVKRKFFGTLVNTYNFFVMYANIDKFIYDKDKIIPVENRPEIDKWLISSLNSLIASVDKSLLKNNITKAARNIQDFVIDDLSNWYIRRNRRRFWKSEMNEDKFAAYQTLYETLFTLAKLLAPFIPFLTDEIYCNLSFFKNTDVESVHLSQYPDPRQEKYSYLDPTLLDSMKTARDVVIMCRSVRNDVQIKVRQPLDKVTIVTQGKRQRKAVKFFEDLILEEINVNKLEFTDDVSELIEKKARPVFKKLGPKFGSNVNQVADIITNFSEEEVKMLEKGEIVHISMNKGNEAAIASEDVEIYTESKEGLVVNNTDGLTIALDVRLTDDLIVEGYAREFVNRVQKMRKEADFNVTDRVNVYYNGSDKMQKSIAAKGEYIKQEVLAIGLQETLEKGEYSKEWKINDESIKIAIERTKN
ncbi:MAG: isoleucine--tRNA ligase [bacterium]